VYQAINRFCTVELSALYVDVTKDRLYCDPENSVARRSTQTVMRLVVDTLVRLLAPITPFTAEEAWEFLGEKESVHLQLFPSLPALDVSADFLPRWEKLLAVRGRVNEQLEKARQTKEIGKSLEAAVVLPEGDAGLIAEDVFAELLIVSQVKRGAELTVGKSSEAKCVRCWKFLPSVGSVAAHPELCARCASAV
jgi:isoleucyl-tRNA synthetase